MELEYAIAAGMIVGSISWLYGFYKGKKHGYSRGYIDGRKEIEDDVFFDGFRQGLAQGLAGGESVSCVASVTGKCESDE